MLAHAGERFDRVFLDPPFREGWLERLWPALAAVLSEDALVYVESETPLPEAIVLDATPPRTLARQRADTAGQVHYHLLRCREAASGDRG